jgi:3-oxoacyl-[acyl-carrier protein] reductase
MAEAGSIALLLSVSAKAPLRDMAISNGLRPGLAALVKTFARELGPRNIRVNALLPGPFATDRARSLTDAGTPPDISDIPLGRLGEPVEFGRVATFLLSPASSFVTGSSFLVDGGMSPAL